jgi:hypothetical protein
MTGAASRPGYPGRLPRPIVAPLAPAVEQREPRDRGDALRAVRRTVEVRHARAAEPDRGTDGTVRTEPAGLVPNPPDRRIFCRGRGGVVMRRSVDRGSAVVIVVTLALFGIALGTKGFTHDVLLEAGVFLVSVKLIVLGYKNAAVSESLHRELEEIKAMIRARPRG